jgi:hypothetical protein
MGMYYYWVEITNTKGVGNSKSINSSIARLNIRDHTLSVGDTELVNSSHINWDGSASAIVIDNGTSFGANNSFATITDLNIPGMFDNLAAFVRLEMVIDTYAGGTLVPVPADQYENNIAYTVVGATNSQQYNGGPGTLVWTLTANDKAVDLSAGGKIRITAGNKTNAVSKVVIKSVKLIAAD